MAHDCQVFEHIAACLEYPSEETPRQARLVAEMLHAQEGLTDGGATAATALADEIESALPGEPEERYTTLFDLKPVCTMNLGYHLFGDTYQRGAFLAELAGELLRRNVEYSQDLPDFLPTLLRLLTQLDDLEDQRLLVYAILIPALDAVNQALKESPGPWPDLLRELPALLSTLVPIGDAMIDVPTRPLEVLPNA
jgi:nitrate reductase molybdenum cofactor assembly chaperone NarJ/NarW